MNATIYTPEMGETRPADAVIDASYSGPGHVRLVTPLVLKGRGINLIQTYTATDLVPQAQHKVGWHQYRVTKAAFGRIEREHKTAWESLLS